MFKYSINDLVKVKYVRDWCTGRFIKIPSGLIGTLKIIDRDNPYKQPVYDIEDIYGEFGWTVEENNLELVYVY